MNDITTTSTTPATGPTLAADGQQLVPAGLLAVTDPTTDTEGPTFAAGYPQTDARIFRARLYPGRFDGVATVTFRGTVADATRCWIERGSSGRLSVYGEVTPTEDTATEIRLAVVPTGKRVPDGGLRLGGGSGQQVYLLSVDSTVDRAAHDEARAARKAERAAARAAARAAWADEADDDEYAADEI